MEHQHESRTALNLQLICYLSLPNWNIRCRGRYSIYPLIVTTAPLCYHLWTMQEPKTHLKNVTWKKAKWELYKDCPLWQQLTNVDLADCRQLLCDLNEKIKLTSYATINVKLTTFIPNHGGPENCLYLSPIEKNHIQNTDKLNFFVTC